jgi:hypothetical protein
MKDINAEVADILAEHLTDFRAEIIRLVAEKPLPPFVPPPTWQPGRHGAGAVIRHRNGLFYARRDTTDEPPTDAWLPLLVGIASIGFEWPDDRTMVLRVELSDGGVIETERGFVVPLARGFWLADTEYREGDRVLRFGDWQAAKSSKGIDPNGADNDGHWLKVTGKQSRAAFNFKLDDDGTMYENGHAIGTIKPLVKELFGELVRNRQ